MDRIHRISQDEQDDKALFLNPVNPETSCESCPFEALILVQTFPEIA
jgi:hypothetical protein